MSVFLDDDSNVVESDAAFSMANGVALPVGKPKPNLVEGSRSAERRPKASIFLLPSTIVVPFPTDDDAAEFFHRLD